MYIELKSEIFIYRVRDSDIYIERESEICI